MDNIENSLARIEGKLDQLLNNNSIGMGYFCPTCRKPVTWENNYICVDCSKIKSSECKAVATLNQSIRVCTGKEKTILGRKGE